MSGGDVLQNVFISSNYFNRPFHKLRHEQRLPRFQNIAMVIDSQRNSQEVYTIYKSN